MSARSPRGLIAAGVLAPALLAAPALAAPPSNDAPTGAGAFAPYTAENGVPATLQAVAELAEAQPDPDVPRCLGSESFARTVWYRIPESSFPVEMTVEASGRRLDVLDLAAFVQAEVPAPAPPDGGPAPPPAGAGPLTQEPNACAGAGAGGSDAAEEPTSAVTLRVPARHPVLVQVGRRGPVRSADDERALVTLESEPLDFAGTPRGDRAGTTTPRLRESRANIVDLVNATISGEDPAQPPCPSLGTVWRRIVPRTSGKRLISADGHATTLTVFSGSRPTGDNVLDCVNREDSGRLQMVVPVKRKRTVWVRIGTDRSPRGYEEATVRVTPGEFATVIDGGPGGFDPTSRGPAGGFPPACDTADVTEARLRGPRLRGRAGARNVFKRVPVRIRLRGASVCDAELRLYGPGGALYAKKRAVRVAPGRRVVRLPRLRTFRPGRYRLEMRGVTLLGQRVPVRGALEGRLTG